MKQIISIQGKSGRIAAILQRPYLAAGAHCPLVILMHGFMANCRLQPIKGLAEALEIEGIASLRFDFDGHGRSAGRFRDMTVLTELEDARAVYRYVKGLDFVSRIGLAGHSQGGVVAGLLAGELGKENIAGLLQLCPAAVLKDDALNGVLMGRRYNPKYPPETLWVMFHRVGRNFFKVAQTLPIYENSCRYEGPVCLIHGTDDKIVPPRYSERYQAEYPHAVLHLIPGENHILSHHRNEIVRMSVQFLKGHLL